MISDKKGYTLHANYLTAKVLLSGMQAMELEQVRVEAKGETFRHTSLDAAIEHAKKLSEGGNSPVFVIDPDRRMEMRYQRGELTRMEVWRRD